MVETLPSLEVVPRGFFDVTVDGRVLLDCGLLEASHPMYKKGEATRLRLSYLSAHRETLTF
jgi:hypothetical protein